MLDNNSVEDALKSVRDISGNGDIVAANRVEKITIDGSSVMLTLNLPTEDVEAKRRVEDDCRKVVKEIGGVAGVMIMTKGLDPPADAHGRGSAQPQSLSEEQMPIEGVQNIIAVSSAKGGVGKSTVCVNLALALRKRGAKVGIMDADVYGPSIHLLLDVMDRPRPGGKKDIAPVEKHGLKLMSIGFLTDMRSPVIWRGPLVMGIVKKFLQEVEWGLLDYLFVDMPPGTGDAQLTLVQTVPLTGAVIVTTPSELALVDAEKGLQMFRTVDAPVLGIVENMSYFVCQHCNEKTEIFGRGGGREISKRLNTELLGEIPLEVQVRTEGDRGRPIVNVNAESPAARALTDIAAKIFDKCPVTV